MASKEYLKILRQGVEVWNKWRKDNPEARPDFEGENLEDLELIDLRKINLSEANLRDANLSGLDLRKANLQDASLLDAILIGTDLSGACLKNTNLAGANLSVANLNSANLCGARIDNTKFCACDLVRTNFRYADLANTVFTEVDLSRVIGLSSVIHSGPSAIGIDTLFNSRGKIPEQFLRDAGVPDALISYLPSLLGAVEPFQFYSCFISYSNKDEKFARRLHSRMREAGLRVWFAPEDMKGGDYFFDQIERAIQLHDRLLLVISKDSIQSKWVEREIRKARKIEHAEKRRKLFPITMMDYDELKKWECLDSDTGEDLAEEVRKYHIPDFSNWKNHDAFEAAFARLEKDLRTSIGE